MGDDKIKSACSEGTRNCDETSKAPFTFPELFSHFHFRAEKISNFRDDRETNAKVVSLTRDEIAFSFAVFKT